MNTMPLEADTRHLIDRNLENLGWNFTGRDKNVFCEQPRTEEERRVLGGKRPDYVLYSKDSDCPLIVIEAKKKGERMDTALEQGIAYAKNLKAPLVFATDGVFCKAFHTYENKTPILNGEELDEFIREALALQFLAKAEINTVSPKVQYDRRELIKIFDDANNMLRGDGLRAGIERFGEFANILFLKLISESEQIKKNYGKESNFDFSCSWDSIKKQAPTARIEYINNMVYNKLNNLYKTKIFTPLIIRDNTILSKIMDKIDPLILTDVDSDIKGDAFEYFLKASTSSGNDLGEYFTPRHIVKTMVRLVNPQIGEKVYDPFCGTGGFLIESFRYIHNNMPRNASTEKMLRENTIYGNEITNTARITKMNMILAGDGHSNIHMKNSLANPVNGEYDVVLANMPYSQQAEHGNLYDLPSKNGDSICVQHCMKAISSLAENGRMALVVPEGFLFRKDLTKTREYLLNNSQLQSIISLPQGVFQPYTNVKTNIIYATKVNQKIPASKKRKDYWYFDVKSDGYTLDNHRRKLDTPSDLIKYEEYRKLDNEQKVEMLQAGFEVIQLDDVQNNDFVLVGSSYASTENMKGKKESFKRFDTFIEFVRGFSYKSDFMAKTGFPMYNLKSIKKDFSTNFDFKFLKEDLEIPEKYICQPNDLLMAITDLTPTSEIIGRAILAKDVGVFSMDLIKLKVDNKVALNKYLYHVLNSDYFLNEAKKFSVGTNVKHLSTKGLQTIKIPIPPLDVQQEIVKQISQLEQETINLQKKLAEIPNQKQFVLDKYLK